MKKLDIESFSKRDCCRKFTDPEYTPPTRDDLNDFLTIVDVNKRVVADTVGVYYHPDKGSPTIRRWFRSPDHTEYREISYSTWHLLLVEFGIVEPLHLSSTDAIK